MIKIQRLLSTTFFIILAQVLLCTCDAAILSNQSIDYPINNSLGSVLSPSDLEEGDIVFWKVRGSDDRAGHIAIITLASQTTKNIRIAHATDHPKYNAFVETYLPPSEKLKKQNRYYFVLRIKDKKMRYNFLKILHEWLQFKIPFNAKNEALMNQWDDSMVSYSTSTKVKLQNQLFSERNNINDAIPQEGFMCSEIMIKALQKAFILKNGKISKLPHSLKLDPTLCPPSTMMLALIKDQKNFKVLGELRVPF